MARRRRYPPELREYAVRLAIEDRRPLGKLASELGVPPDTLQGWVRSERAERTIDALQAADLVQPRWFSAHAILHPGQVAAGDTVYLNQLLGQSDGQRPDLYDLNHLWWGDYTGDAVARSNYRCLTQDFPRSFVYLRDSMRHQGLAVLPSALGNDRLASTLLGLAEYPLYQEEDLTALEMELAEQAWDAYLARDVTRYLERDHGIDCDDLEVPDGQLRELFYEAHSRHGDVYAQNAVDVVFPYLDEAVAEVADSLRRDLPGPEPAGRVARHSADPMPQRGSAFPRGPAAPAAGSGRAVSPPARGLAPHARAPGR